MTLLTVKQTALQLGCSPRHVRRLINDGHLTCVRVGYTNRTDRIEEQELQAFIERRRTRWVSTDVARPGTSDLKKTDEKLDDLLGPARPKRTPTVFKWPSERTLRRKGLSMGEPSVTRSLNG